MGSCSASASPESLGQASPTFSRSASPSSHLRSSPPNPHPWDTSTTSEIICQLLRSQGHISPSSLTSPCLEGRFVRRQPSVEGLEHWVHSSWRLLRPCLISLMEKGILSSGSTLWKIELG
ncbi:hypothetical protein MRB53_030884 [Persea americana]|uniref:Uncharacterized protein n=1 Tax=Persea americana TaxID=3435 RepID=A0ACC2KN30_PERAE|nr:hypothetical protein MRB53_030884 [Persea americana]